MSDCSPDAFKTALRRLASGVSLIATAHEGARHGLVATAVTSVTADPPTLLVCVNRTASILPHLEAAGVFCVNLLTESQADLARRFALPRDRETRFDLGDWATLATGAPALGGAAASLDCRVARVMDYGSHRLVFGEVVATAFCEGRPGEGAGPLLYHEGDFRALAA
ncbi:flavin reductase family protein [Rubellimicrobium aerolatum]|uniref:Flavin reductase family protein n=1 Tax=Rubellimicrobium aerolatum TaxID=490979 RepID=A0ABW0SC80_9RHOB|nr:flavin reductase family protein [Rubellimicrobium aerolatum]MBP1806285.1 flavin reductase [Rubellimicrobium aerolatum]